jgi:hypothetical protein
MGSIRFDAEDIGMRFFRRKKEEEKPKEAGQLAIQPNVLQRDAVQPPAPPAPPEPEEAEWQPGQYAKVTEDGLVWTNVANTAEAKLAIKQLRLAKRVLQAQKKELAALKTQQNARWRDVTAGRLPIYTGSSKSFMGNMVRYKRRGERMEHAEAVNRITEQTERINSIILDIDREIMSAEALILRMS